MLNVQIISKEVIKPSSPTPHHLRNHNLSWLDQIAPPVHIPFIFFYNDEQLMAHKLNRGQIFQQLKTSLSDALTLFYPFAGKIIDNYSVECNDDGAELIEALAHTHLSRVIENPDMEELKQFLPFDPCYSIEKKLILAVQVNYLDCGGIILGVCVSHTVADGSSVALFVASWAAKCNGASNTNIKKPNFDLAVHFPAREYLKGFEMNISLTEEKIITKRFVFDKNMITSTKKMVSGPKVMDPTRVEAISTFLWMLFTKLANAKNKRSAIGHSVNLRPRMSSSDSENEFIGNFYINSFVIAGLEECQSQDLVVLLRKYIKETDNNYVKKLANIEDYLDSRKSVGEMLLKGEIELCNFSSWCRFGLHEVDFGWGGPAWACTTTLPYKNLVILMSTSSGDGIEAWINLLADDMAVLEQDKEFLSLFSHQY